MTVVPCDRNVDLDKLIIDYVEALKIRAHEIGNHGLSEHEFYDSGLFRGAVERIRGQFSAEIGPKKAFARDILNYMQDQNYIGDWHQADGANRHDYAVSLKSGRTAVIELKGCLDGNNTNIFSRPPHAHEFIIWSLCTNPGAAPRKNVWSGIHTRLSADIIDRGERVDGVVIWDMMCGTRWRPCPKLTVNPSRMTEIGQFKLPPPCLYLFPATIPAPRNNPKPPPQTLADVQIMDAFHRCFKGSDAELNFVSIETAHFGAETVRTTTISRNAVIQKKSGPTSIKRS